MPSEKPEASGHPGDHKAGRRAERRGLIIVFTGAGKGKTTAALGMVLRAWGRGMRVAVLQFIKHSTSNYGETRALRRMGIENIALGDGFTWLSKDLERSAALAQELWQTCKAKIASGQYDIIVLDEATYPMKFGWVSTEEVLEVLRGRPEGLHIILTGRDPPAALLDAADLVTEMREVKHPYRDQGLLAQPGIEY
jgi:cob(I)alamin adenosyltransferase